MIPAKNEGAEIPKMANAFAERSIQVSLLTAEITPRKIPIRVAKIIAVRASTKVFGTVSARMLLTSRLVW